MRSSLVLDVAWTTLAGGVTVGGIVLVAQQQGTIGDTGTRIALITAAIILGMAGGMITERLTRPRRRRRSRGPSPRVRHRNRKIAFMLSGIIIVIGIISIYLADHTWLIFSASIVMLAVIWMWYTLEAMGVVRAGQPRSNRRCDEGYRRRK